MRFGVTSSNMNTTTNIAAIRLYYFSLSCPGFTSVLIDDCVERLLNISVNDFARVTLTIFMSH